MDVQIDETEYSNDDAQEVLEIEKQIEENIREEKKESSDTWESDAGVCAGKVVGIDKREDYDGTHIEVEVSPSDHGENISEKFKIPNNPKDDKTEFKRLFDWSDVSVTSVRNLISKEIPLKKSSDKSQWRIDVPPVKTKGNYAIYRTKRSLSDKGVTKPTSNGVQVDDRVKTALLNMALIVNCFTSAFAINALVSMPLTVPLVELPNIQIISAFLLIIYSMTGGVLAIMTVITLVAMFFENMKERLFPSPN